MLTLKLITEERERVIKGLKKKRFHDAEQAIDAVLAVDKKRREAQQVLDASLSEQKKAAAEIGKLMKTGDKAAADEAKAKVAELKEKSAAAQETKDSDQEELVNMLCQITNFP